MADNHGQQPRVESPRMASCQGAGHESSVSGDSQGTNGRHEWPGRNIGVVRRPGLNETPLSIDEVRFGVAKGIFRMEQKYSYGMVDYGYGIGIELHHCN